MKPSIEREQRLYDALKRITSYDDPYKLVRRSERDYGLSGTEAIEYAYENVLETAKAAIRGMRRPVAAKSAAGATAPSSKPAPDGPGA